MSITKSTLVQQLLSNEWLETLTTKQITKAIETMIDLGITAIKDKKQIYITRVGVLAPNRKSARPGRNPKTGEPHTISPRTVYTLVKAGKPNNAKYTKRQWIADLSFYAEIPMRKAEIIVNHFYAQIEELSTTANRIELRGFGSFWTTVRNERNVRNPKTGEALVQATHNKVMFKLSSLLAKDFVE